MNKTLLIGVGNPWRRDDGIGPSLIRLLATSALPAQISLLEHHGEGLSLLDSWQGFTSVLIIDAIHARAPAGTLYCFDCIRDELPRGLFHYSSHQFGLAEAVALARTLNRLPPQLLVYGIVGTAFSHGEGLCVPVARAVERLAEQIRLQLDCDTLNFDLSS